MNVLRICLSVCLLQLAVSAAAQEEEAFAAMMPEGSAAMAGDCDLVASLCGPQSCLIYPGWFVGVGGSYNSVKVDMLLSGSATTDIYSNGTLVAIGAAGGPAPPFRETLTTFAPVAQVGYVRNFARSDWLWGGKFSYKYLGLTFSDNGIDAPQTGVYEVLDPPSTDTFTGNALADSAQAIVNHELALIPFLGRSFGRGHVYAGGGPVVFATESRNYGLSSYADINGEHTNIGGAPLNLASSAWIWGGAWQMGLVYFLSPCCFFDFSYDFMVTGVHAHDYPVNVTSTSDGLTYETDITYREEMRIWAQSFTVSFNLRF